MEMVGEQDHSRRSYCANLERSTRALGREVCRLRQPGWLTSAQALSVLTTIWGRNTAYKHLAQLRDMRVLVLLKRRYYLPNFLRCNATAEEMEQRREADREQERAKKRRQRSRKSPNPRYKPTVDSASKSSDCGDVPPVQYQPRASALRAGLRCASVRYGGGARPPWRRGPWPMQKAPPPRPFTDTELDALQDEFDALDRERADKAAKSANLAGDPPAAPGPRPAKGSAASPLPVEDPTAGGVPPIPGGIPRALFAAVAAGDVAAMKALGDLSATDGDGRDTGREEPEALVRSVSATGKAKIEDRPRDAPERGSGLLSPLFEAKSANKALADEAFALHLQREHMLMGVPINRVAILREQPTRDTLRQAFEVTMEARRGKGVRDVGRHVLGTVRNMHRWGFVGPPC